ncbi:MAG: hypothetical protein ACI9RU_001902 [Litorivivens sp.]|jgi:hypothetical protein
MKGIVITQFLEMVEDRHGLELADKLLSSDGLSTNGGFTSVGTYPHQDAGILMTAFGKSQKKDISQVLLEYGKFLFGRFASNYPNFFHEGQEFFAFLESVETVIHPQVLKLYPDAQLPRFETEVISDVKMRMVYRSDRRMGPFAHGLIIGCSDYFDVSVGIQSKDIEEGKKVEFIITKID